MNVLNSPWSFSWWWYIFSPSNELVLIYIQNRNHSLRLFESTVWTLSALLCDIVAQTACWLDPCVSDLWPLQRWSTSAPDASLRRSCSTCSVTRASTRKCTLTPTTVWARVTTCTHGTTRWTISSCCCRYELADSTRAEHRLCYCSQFSFRALRASSVRRMFTDMIKNKSPRENEEKKCKRLLFFWPRGIIRLPFNLERKN